MSAPCPSCQKALPKNRKDCAFFPFCSDRCRKLDLAKWLDGDYRLSSHELDSTQYSFDEEQPS